MLAVKLKEVVQSAICESTVYFRSVDRYVSVRKFHADVFAGVVVVMKFHFNSGTGEAARELIPRLTAINHLTDPLLKYRNFVLVFLFQWRVCESVFVLDSLDNLVATFVIVAFINGFAVKIHPVIDDMDMRMPGFKMAHYKILRVLDSHSFHILLGELSHEIIGQSWRVGVVKTDGNMSCRILFAGHKSMYSFKRLHHFSIVGSENIIASDDAPCVGCVLFRVVELARHIPHDIVKRAAFKYSCKHNQSLYWASIF